MESFCLILAAAALAGSGCAASMSVPDTAASAEPVDTNAACLRNNLLWGLTVADQRTFGVTDRRGKRNPNFGTRRDDR